jgi:hypothetical protein
MPLAHFNSHGYEDQQGVHFPMMHNNTIIRILVTREVLQGLKGSAPEEGNYMASFEAHRKEFEAIATNKFEHGQFRAMMKITREDVLRFAIARLNSR